MPHPTIRTEVGPSYRQLPRYAYGVTSDRKCLASFSIRFNRSPRSLGSCPSATRFIKGGIPADNCANSSASRRSFAGSGTVRLRSKGGSSGLFVCLSASRTPGGIGRTLWPDSFAGKDIKVSASRTEVRNGFRTNTSAEHCVDLCELYTLASRPNSTIQKKPAPQKRGRSVKVR